MQPSTSTARGLRSPVALLAFAAAPLLGLSDGVAAQIDTVGTVPRVDSVTTPPDSPPWQDEVSIQGTLIGVAAGEATSGLRVGEAPDALAVQTLELAVESSGPDRSTSGSVVFDASGLVNAAQDVSISEAHIRISDGERLFISIDAGPLPFGSFANALLSQPLSQDVYGAQAMSVSAGWTPADNAHVAVAWVDGRPMYGQWLGAGVVDSAAADPAESGMTDSAGSAAGEGTSWIVSASRSILGDRLSGGAAVLTEAGAAPRSRFLNAWASSSGLGHPGVEVDVEVFRGSRALPLRTNGTRFMETTVSTTVSLTLPAAPGGTRTGRTFQGRRAHRRARPFELAVRFEAFLDDGMAEALNTWTARNRMAVGGRYSFDPDDTFPGFVTIEIERRTFRDALNRTAGRTATVQAGIGLVF
ncbi:MAG: hypothetical protein R3E10_14965 [Gemmatimonadota bacterium]